MEATSPESHQKTPDVKVLQEGQTTTKTNSSSSLPVQNEASEKNDDITTEEYQFVTGPRLYVIIISVTLVYFLVELGSSINSTAIPQITTQFHSLNDVAWYGTAFIFTSSCFQPLSGKIFKSCSNKWSYFTFFAIFELGSLLCGVAQSSSMLIAGRAISGLGSSGLMNGALTIASATLPAHKLPAIVGFVMSLGQIGVACGPIIGGALTQFSSWRWCYFINLPVGALVGILLLMARIPDSTPKKPLREVLRTSIKSFDLPGFAIFAPATIMFLLAITWGGNQYAWNSATIIGLFCGAAATFALFLVWEYHQGNDAMIPFSMISKRILWAASGTMFFFLGTIFCTNYYLPIFFQSVKNATPLHSGVSILPVVLAEIVMAMVAGTGVQKFGHYLPWILVGIVLTAVGDGLLSTLQMSTPASRWIGYQIIFGGGCGMAVSIPSVAIQNLVTAADIPVAMGTFIFVQNLGAALLLLASGNIFTNSLRTEIPKKVPGLNPEIVITAGARGIRQVVKPNQLLGVLEAYNTSISRVMYLNVGTAVAAFAFAWGLGWKDIRKSKSPTQETDSIQSQHQKVPED